MDATALLGETTIVAPHRRPVALQGLSTRERVLAERINRLVEEASIADRLLHEAQLGANESNTLYQGNQRSLAALRRIARSLGDHHDVHSICHTVVEAIAEEVGVEHCSVMLLEDGERELRLEAGAARSELAGAPNEARVFRLGVGVAGEVARTREAIRVDDTELDPRWLPADDRVVVRSLLCIPLFGGDRLLGVLNLSHPAPGFFRAEHMRVFDVLCPIVGQLISFAGLQVCLRELNHGLEEEVRRRIEEVRDTQASLARREKLAALGETVSGIAHELNNRLTPVTVYAESLLESRLSARETKQVKAIADATAGVRSIVESLLGFSRQRKPRKASVDLNEVLAGTVSVIKFTLQRDGILVRTAFEERLPRTMADPQQVEQVALNLIQNARDAIRVSDHAQTGIIMVSTEREDGWIVVSVRDNGCGIPPESMDKIMQPFYTTKPQGEGTGLGLAMCYGIMTEHGGDLTVTSQPGDTTFFLRFPLVQAPVTGENVTPPMGERKADLPKDLKLLIVDDEQMILDLLHDVLDGRVLVDTAASGIEALQKLSVRDYDVVLSDMRMPGLGGRDIYRWLKENRPGREASVIFATGDTFDPVTYDFITAVEAVCLAKPFTIKGVVAAIRRVIEG